MLIGPDGEVGVPVHTTPPPPPPPPKTGTNAPNFKQAVTNAQTATDNYRSTGSKTDLNTAEQDWGNVQAIIEDQYQQAYASSKDPNAVKKAVSKLDQEYKNYFQDQGNDTAIYKQVLSTAQQDVQKESKTPGLCSALHQEYVAGTKLQNDQQQNISTSSSTYQTDATTFVQDELKVQLLEKFGDGKNGVYTASQVQQAADAVNAQNGAKAGSGGAEFTDFVAYLTAIQDKSIALTPAEQQVATADPYTLAFLMADGVSIQGTDKNGNLSANAPLSQPMLDLAKNNSSLFAYMELNGVNIAVTKSKTQYALGNGEYLSITDKNGKQFIIAGFKINGQEVSTQDVVSAYNYQNATNPGQGAAVVADMILSSPNVSITPSTIMSKSNQGLANLMGDADLMRSQADSAQLKTLLAKAPPATSKSAPGYLAKTINPFLTKQLNGFFDPTTFWNDTAAPLLEPYVKGGLTAAFQNGKSRNIYDYMGGYLRQALPGASSQEAQMMINVVEGLFKGVNLNGSNGYPVEATTLIDGLSTAVQIVDNGTGNQDAANQVAGWLNSKANARLLTGSANGFYYDADQGNSDLGSALWNSIDTLGGGRNLLDDNVLLGGDMSGNIQRGTQDYQSTIQKQVNSGNYNTFESIKSGVLKNYFNQFKDSSFIGKTLKVSGNTPELTKAIATSLGYDPNNLTTTQKQTVSLDISWIQSEAGSNGTVTILPYLFASSTAGVEDGVFFQVTSHHYTPRHYTGRGGWVPEQSWTQTVLIDGLAAQTALQMDPDAWKHPDNVDVKWKYNDFGDFQLNNDLYQNGTIYQLKNNKVTIGSDGNVQWTASASSTTNAWKDIEGWINVGTAVVGTTAGILAAPMTGGLSLGLTAISIGSLAWATVDAGIQIDDMVSHGEHFGWSNPNARQAILGDAMLAANWATMGLGFAAGGFERAAASYGEGATTLADTGNLSRTLEGGVENAGDSLLKVTEGDGVPVGDTLPGGDITPTATTDGIDPVTAVAAAPIKWGAIFKGAATGFKVTEKAVNYAAMGYGTFQAAQTLDSLETNWDSMSWSERSQAILNIAMGVFPFFQEGVSESFNEFVWHRNGRVSSLAHAVEAGLRQASLIPADAPSLAGKVRVFDDIAYTDRYVKLGGSKEDAANANAFVITKTDGTVKTIAVREGAENLQILVSVLLNAHAKAFSEPTVNPDAASVETTIRNKYGSFINGEAPRVAGMMTFRDDASFDQEYIHDNQAAGITVTPEEAEGLSAYILRNADDAVEKIVIRQGAATPEILGHELLHAYATPEFRAAAQRLAVETGQRYSNLSEAFVEYLTHQLFADSLHTVPTREEDIARQIVQGWGEGKDHIDGIGEETLSKALFAGDEVAVAALFNKAVEHPEISVAKIGDLARIEAGSATSPTAAGTSDLDRLLSDRKKAFRKQLFADDQKAAAGGGRLPGFLSGRTRTSLLDGLTATGRIELTNAATPLLDDAFTAASEDGGRKAAQSAVNKKAGSGRITRGIVQDSVDEVVNVILAQKADEAAAAYEQQHPGATDAELDIVRNQFRTGNESAIRDQVTSYLQSYSKRNWKPGLHGWQNRGPKQLAELVSRWAGETVEVGGKTLSSVAEDAQQSKLDNRGWLRKSGDAYKQKVMGGQVQKAMETMLTPTVDAVLDAAVRDVIGTGPDALQRLKNLDLNDPVLQKAIRDRLPAQWDDVTQQAGVNRFGALVAQDTAFEAINDGLVRKAGQKAARKNAPEYLKVAMQPGLETWGMRGADEALRPADEKLASKVAEGVVKRKALKTATSDASSGVVDRLQTELGNYEQRITTAVLGDVKDAAPGRTGTGKQLAVQALDQLPVYASKARENIETEINASTGMSEDEKARLRNLAQAAEQIVLNRLKDNWSSKKVQRFVKRSATRDEDLIQAQGARLLGITSQRYADWRTARVDSRLNGAQDRVQNRVVNASADLTEQTVQDAAKWLRPVGRKAARQAAEAYVANTVQASGTGLTEEIALGVANNPATIEGAIIAGTDAARTTLTERLPGAVLDKSFIPNPKEAKPNWRGRAALGLTKPFMRGTSYTEAINSAYAADYGAYFSSPFDPRLDPQGAAAAARVAVATAAGIAPDPQDVAAVEAATRRALVVSQAMPAKGNYVPDQFTMKVAEIPGGIEQIVAGAHEHQSNYARTGTVKNLMEKFSTFGRGVAMNIPQNCGDIGHYSHTAPHGMEVTPKGDQVTYDEWSRMPLEQKAKVDPAATGVDFTPEGQPAEYVKKFTIRTKGNVVIWGEITSHKELVFPGLGDEAWEVDSPEFMSFLAQVSEIGGIVTLHCDWGDHALSPAGRAAPGTQHYEYVAKLKAVFGQFPDLNIILAHTGIGRMVRPDDTISTQPHYLTGLRDPVTGKSKLMWARDAVTGKLSTRPEITAPEHIHQIYAIFEALPNARVDISWNDVSQAYDEMRYTNPQAAEAIVQLFRIHRDRILFGTDTVKPVNEGQYNQNVIAASPLMVEVLRRDIADAGGADKLTEENSAAWKILRGNYERDFGKAYERVGAWVDQQLPAGERAQAQRERDELKAEREKLKDGAWGAFKQWAGLIQNGWSQEALNAPAGAYAAVAALNPGGTHSGADEYTQTGQGTSGGSKNDSTWRKGAAAAGATVVAGAGAAGIYWLDGHSGNVMDGASGGGYAPGATGSFFGNDLNAASFAGRAIKNILQTAVGETQRLQWEAMFEEGRVPREALDRYVSRLFNGSSALDITEAQRVQISDVTEQFWANYQHLRSIPLDESRGWTAQHKFNVVMEEVGRYAVTVDRLLNMQGSSISPFDGRRWGGKLVRAVSLASYADNIAVSWRWVEGSGLRSALDVLANSPHHGIAGVAQAAAVALDMSFRLTFLTANVIQFTREGGSLIGGVMGTTGMETNKFQKGLQRYSLGLFTVGGGLWTADGAQTLVKMSTQWTGLGSIPGLLFQGAKVGLEGLFTYGAARSLDLENRAAKMEPMPAASKQATPSEDLNFALGANESAQLIQQIVQHH